MDAAQQDSFVVFVRLDGAHVESPEDVERAMGECGSMEEARQLQRSYHRAACSCVIRFAGIAGGGD